MCVMKLICFDGESVNVLVHLSQWIVSGGVHMQAAYIGYGMLGDMSSMVTKYVLEGESDGYKMRSGGFM